MMRSMSFLKVSSSPGFKLNHDIGYILSPGDPTDSYAIGIFVNLLSHIQHGWFSKFQDGNSVYRWVTKDIASTPLCMLRRVRTADHTYQTEAETALWELCREWTYYQCPRSHSFIIGQNIGSCLWWTVKPYWTVRSCGMKALDICEYL